MTPNIIVPGTSGIVVDNFNQVLPPFKSYDPNGHCALSEAIAAVNAHSGVDACRGDLYTTIILTNGTYIFTQANNSVGSNGALDGLPLITGNSATGYQVTIEGNNSTLNSTSMRYYPSQEPLEFRIFDVASGTHLTIKNIVATNGFIPSWGAGGVILNSGTLTVIGSVFENSISSNSGGDIYNTNAANLYVESSVFIGTTTSYGGAVQNAGLATLVNNSFVGGTNS